MCGEWHRCGSTRRPELAPDTADHRRCQAQGDRGCAARCGRKPEHRSGVARRSRGGSASTDRRRDAGSRCCGRWGCWAASVPGIALRRSIRDGTISHTIRLAGCVPARSPLLWEGLDRASSATCLIEATRFHSNAPSAGLDHSLAAVGHNRVADYVRPVAEVDLRSGQAVSDAHWEQLQRLAPAITDLVANTLDSTVLRINPASGSVTIPVGSGPTAVVVAVVVRSGRQSTETLSCIDPPQCRCPDHRGRNPFTAPELAASGRGAAARRAPAGPLVLHQRPIS
jgi:hypothetical protein